MKIFISARVDRKEIERLQQAGADIEFGGYGVTGEKLSEAELTTKLADVDIAITEFENITEQVLSRATKLKYLACLRNEPGASVDMVAAKKKKLPILFAPGRNAISVAEYTIGLMLAATRFIAQSHHLLRYTDELTSVNYNDKQGERGKITSEWSLDPGAPFQRFQGEELFEKTAGIVGFGMVGQEIGRRLHALGMNLLVFDPYVTDEKLREFSAKKVDLETISRESDFVIIAAKVTEETKGMFGAKNFKLMKQNAYFINTARAALVDYDALIEALSKKKIAGAALDVYPSEPLQSESKLRELDNVVLSPHLAGATFDVVKHHTRMVVSDVLTIMKGERPKYVFNPEVL